MLKDKINYYDELIEKELKFARMKKYEDEIYALAGEKFNIASPKQLQTVLFEELGLPAFSSCTNKEKRKRC